MIYLLDTNVFMHLANKSAGHENIERHMAHTGADHLRLSAIALAELRTKILRGEGRVKKENQNRLKVIVDNMQVQDFTRADAECAAVIMSGLEAIGTRNEWPDVMIAGQAANAGYTLVTDDSALLATAAVKSVNWRL